MQNENTIMPNSQILFSRMLGKLQNLRKFPSTQYCQQFIPVSYLLSPVLPVSYLLLPDPKLDPRTHQRRLLPLHGDDTVLRRGHPESADSAN